MSTFALNKNLGLPLKVIDNLDGTCTLLVDGISTPALNTPPRINAPIGVATTTPGSEQSLVAYTVGSGLTHIITQLIFSCRVEGVASLYINGALQATQRTSAASPNANIIFPLAYPIANTGDTIEGRFTARLNSAATDVECKIVGYELS